MKKRIDTRDKGPKDLAAATGDGIDFVGSIQLDVKIGERKVAWKAWVARRLVVPFIVGTDTLDQKSTIDFRNHTWEYEGETVPIQIERRPEKVGEVMTVVAQKNWVIPQFAAITGMGKIVNNIGDIPTQRVVDLTGLRWSRAAVQSGITDT